MAGLTIAWSWAEHVFGRGFALSPILLPIKAACLID
jgi:hypothetical protein